jgi:hypothetical protein
MTYRLSVGLFYAPYRDSAILPDMESRLIDEARPLVPINCYQRTTPHNWRHLD